MKLPILALLGVLCTAAAAPLRHGLVYTSPVSSTTRRSGYGGARYYGYRRTPPMMMAGYRGRSPVLAAQLGGNVVGDTVFGGLHNFLSLYNLVLTARILLSWFPQFARQPVFEPLFVVTSPFFNLFRGLIPPIGGVDLSPLPAFFLLSFVTQATESMGAELPPNAANGAMLTSRQQPASTLIRCGTFRFHVPTGIARRFTRP